jgi:hypothetical protein
MLPTDPVHAQAPAVKLPFSEEMIQDFHKDDKHAATVIVCLMSVIFVIGLLLYLGVCFWVSQPAG